MNLFAAIARDPNVSPDLRRLYNGPRATPRTAAPEQSNQLTRRDSTHRHERQYLAEPHTPSAFGALGPDRLAEIRADEHADQLADERREEGSQS